MPVTGQSSWHIDSLNHAFKRGFDMVREEQDQMDGPQFAEKWSDLVASILDGVRITAMPPSDLNTPFLPFEGTHRIRAESLLVARGGMWGGPCIDLLLQVCFDTEDMVCGYGTPVLFRTIPPDRRLPAQMWADLKDTCRKVVQATPSGRIVFLSNDEDGFEKFLRYNTDADWMLATDMHSFAGGLLPPRPLRGRRMKDFCLDLASGWTGDPALSGQEPNRMLDSLLNMFDVANVLRVRIEREDRSPIWQDAPLPF